MKILRLGAETIVVVLALAAILGLALAVVASDDVQPQSTVVLATDDAMRQTTIVDPLSDPD
jgi:hypothetical protein